MDASELILKVAEKSGDMFQAAAGIITDSIVKYGPQAIDAVLWVVRIDAAGDLLSAFFWIILALILGYLTFLGNNKYTKWKEEMHPVDKTGNNMVVSLILAAMLLPNIGTVTDIWNYVAIAKPELYLVKKTMDAVERQIKK